MKYNDNGTYKDIYVKTFDTLPINSIVGYTSSTIPSGWESIGNNQIKKVSQAVSQDYSVNGTYNTSQSQAYSCKYINDTLGKEVIYSGALQGTQTTTLSNVKRFLKIYAVANDTTPKTQIITYEIDTERETTAYGSGIGIAYDEVGGLDYYLSEASYNSSTGVLTHTRTGFFKIGAGTYTARNTNDKYVIYRVETYN